MNKRLQMMIDKDLIPNRGGVFIDAYNQSINEDIAGTITTRVDASNSIYVTELCDTSFINTQEERIKEEF